MNSLIESKQEFFKATQCERDLQEELERRMGEAVNEGIKLGRQEVIFTVPPGLNGFFIPYDHPEMILWCLRRARFRGYDAVLEDREAGKIKISGWASGSWLKENRPGERRTVQFGRKRTSVLQSIMKKKV